MRKFAIVCALPLGAAAVSACGGDDVTLYPSDAASARHEASTADVTVLPDSDGGPDTSAPPADASPDATPPPPARLLLSINNTATSELVALNVGSKKVDGRFVYPGFIGTTFTGGDAPWLLEQANDLVVRLDRQEPWRPLSSWNVALTDKKDGGDAYSDPYAVVVGAGPKGYVLRFTRNILAVLDTSKLVDAGAPQSTIDLASLVQPNDGDGLVDMTTGFFVPSRHLVYVVLGNYDKNLFGASGLACSKTVATVTAIDTMTDQIVSLGGNGPGGSIQLLGFSPANAVYDAAGDRILVVHDGCTATSDGGTAVVRSGVEEVSLASKTTKMLLDANALGFPGAFAYVDPTHAVIGFGFGQEVHAWDPTKTTVGAPIPNAPDANSFVADGLGNILGVRTTPIDGGKTLDIVSVRIENGQSTTLAKNPFTDNTGFIGGVQLWPHP